MARPTVDATPSHPPVSERAQESDHQNQNSPRSRPAVEKQTLARPRTKKIAARRSFPCLNASNADARTTRRNLRWPATETLVSNPTAILFQSIDRPAHSSF